MPWPRLLAETLLVPMALVGLLALAFVFRGGDQPEKDRAALVAFYHATDGDNWHVNSNWLSDEHIGAWYGVTTFLGDVQRLHLPNNGLRGQIPAELGSLRTLSVLDLSENDLSGPIPTELGTFPLLETLNLSHNSLSGSIPAELGSLPLRGLNLSHNSLSGPIPAELASHPLQSVLDLRQNNLSGPIPAELGASPLVHWEPDEVGPPRLWLARNELSGCIPHSLRESAMVTDLAWLGLPYCGVAGPPVPIPPTPDREALVALYEAAGGPNWKRSTNWMTDAPIAWWHGVGTDGEGRVTYLELRNNRLTGSIPVELASLKKLEILILENNELTGAIPFALSYLRNLEILYLSGNQLSGCIPLRLDAQTHDLASLGLRDCKL